MVQLCVCVGEKMTNKCIVVKCGRECKSNYCSKHYQQIRNKGGVFSLLLYKKCVINMCNGKIHKHKYHCNKHGSQIYLKGSITETRFDKNEIIIYKKHAEIILKNKFFEIIGKSLVDIEDVDIIKKHKWCLSSSNGYVMSGTLGKCLHMFLVGIHNNSVIDHINGNKLDNRRYNLRIASKSLNTFNSKPHKDNLSGIKGITFSKPRKKWIAQIRGN